MNRELTRREKILLLVLIVVVLVAGYCKLILIPINDQISSYRLNMEAEQTELDANQGKMAQMQKMQKAIEEIKAAGEKRTIPQYDNSGKLMIELHEIMSDTLDYSLDCSALRRVMRTVKSRMVETFPSSVEARFSSTLLTMGDCWITSNIREI